MAKFEYPPEVAALKANVEAHLGKGFTVSVSIVDGLSVSVYYAFKAGKGKAKAKAMAGVNAAELKVEKMAKALNLRAHSDKLYIEPSPITSLRTWNFINVEVEKRCMEDADNVVRAIRTFFKKHPSFCASGELYNKVRTMCRLLGSNKMG